MPLEAWVARSDLPCRVLPEEMTGRKRNRKRGHFMAQGKRGVWWWVYLALVVVSVQGRAEPLVEAGCGEGAGAVEMRLAVAESGDAMRVAYVMSREIRTLELSWPEPGKPAQARMSHLVVESDGAEVDGEGRILFREPVREVSVVVSPEPPEQRYAAQYPTAFAVDGRGIAVFVPFLLPRTAEGCGAASVVLVGDEGVRAVADGVHIAVEEDREIADQSGFVLLGRNLEPNSAVQLATTLPAWLDEVIRDSDERAHRELVRILGVARKSAAVLVDYFVAGSDAPRNGGDASGERCSMRLWFRGKGWEGRSDELGERVFLLLTHELAHCYQQGKIWLPWAHEGHARFLESLISARPDGDYLPGTFAEERLVGDFNSCMNDLRVRDRHIDAYSCGSVAYWLRWLETGRVTMLKEEDVQNPEERQTLAGRFLLRTATEEDVVDFLRSAGIAVEVEEDVAEGDRAVRNRLVMTLLKHGCPAGTGPTGLWTNKASVKLDGCPEFDQLEVEAVAGRHIIEDAHDSYEAAIASCRADGRVALTGVDGEVRWIRCDPEHDWPSTDATRHRLVSPFATVPMPQR